MIRVLVGGSEVEDFQMLVRAVRDAEIGVSAVGGSSFLS